MRVLLVPPTFKYKTGYPAALSITDFPTGFGYLAAVLKKAGHTVIGCNPNNIVGYPSAPMMLADVLSRSIVSNKPDYVCLGGLSIDYKFFSDAITLIRNVGPKVKIILGGRAATNDAEGLMELLHPDYLVVGEGENAILDIVEDRVEKGIVKGKHVEDLDSVPFPDYEPFGIQDMMDNYSMTTRLLYRYTRPYPRPFVIVASRSCPFSCTFCIHGHRDIPYRARSIKNIIAEIKDTYEKYKFNVLTIDDELFAVNKERMVEFCNAVLEGKEKYGWDFDWMFQTHASSKLDIETLKLAKKAGCFLFSYGLESASPVVLKSMNKKIEVSQVLEAMELAHESKIGFSANLIFGDIAETQDTWAESLAFWLKYCRQDFVFLANLMPYPGSKLFDDLVSYGAFKDRKFYYEHIDEGAINMSTIPPDVFVELLKTTVGLEKSWLFVALAKNVRIEVEGVVDRTGETMYKIWATCPYCGEESLYRQPLSTVTLTNFQLGSGCTKCNRKMKIIDKI
jgi:anaerobic magnesium-protoporphyrin IX monomethyl ester cyclase